MGNCACARKRPGENETPFQRVISRLSGRGKRTDHADGDQVDYYQKRPASEEKVKPKKREPFNATKEAEKLKNAIEARKDAAIVDILCSRTNAQRQELRSTYQTQYGKDLQVELSHYCGEYKDSVISALLMLPDELDVEMLHKAITGGLWSSVITEILCCRSNEQIENLKANYAKKYSKHLEDALREYFCFEKDTLSLLRRLAAVRREESQSIDQEKCADEAQELYQALNKSKPPNWHKFVDLVAPKTPSQLERLFSDYRKEVNHHGAGTIRRTPTNEFAYKLGAANGEASKKKKDAAGEDLDASTLVENSARKVFIDDFLLGPFLAFIKLSVKPHHVYFAERLRQALQHELEAHNDATILSLLISRAEIDLREIKKAYKERYNTSLLDSVKAYVPQHPEQTFVSDAIVKLVEYAD